MNPLEALPSMFSQTELGGAFSADTLEEPSIPCFCRGECCGRYQIRLNSAEARRIAGGLGSPWEESLGKCTHPAWPGAMNFPLSLEDGAWELLERECQGSRANCPIHSFKPSSCREWNSGLDRRECQDGLNQRWGLTVNSSGKTRVLGKRRREFQSCLEFLVGYRENGYADLRV